MKWRCCSCVAACGFLLCGLFLNPLSATPANGQEDASTKQPGIPVDHAKRMQQGLQLFRERVRPILTEHCLDCHGGESIKADFDLSSRDSLLASGFVGESAKDSYLLQLIKHEAEPHMPLKADKLSETDIEVIRNWIHLGAPYDKPLAEQRVRQSATMEVTDSDRRFWAFQPLSAVPIPEVDHVEWCRTPIDRFILSAQEKVGLLPNGPAASRNLVRRAAFDLHGLPATMEEVSEFEQQASPDAWENLVSRLLDSPHYGERWARHWMDVARFAESHGYEQDYDRPNAYHYRDFLIRAFNEDLPFDQFVQWQLAGDELAPENPLAMMATGFLGAGAFPTQLTEAEFESARYDELDDMVATTGVAFLGLSVGCARCHDHKFDPIPSVDYYRMASNFTSTIRSEIELDLDPKANQGRRNEWEERLTELQEDLAAFEQTEVPALFAAWLPGYIPGDSVSDWETLTVSSVSAENQSKFELQEDASWLAVGKAPNKDIVTITAESRGKTAGALRLETLVHDSLPNQGPGRAANGNFALGDIRISVVPLARSSEPVDIRLVTARATHQQNEDSLSVNASIDDDPISGWAVDGGGIGKDQAAVFDFAETIGSDRGHRWTIVLRQQHPNTQHAIGRFRFSIGNKAGLAATVGDSGVDPAIANSLEVAQTNGDQTAEAWKIAQRWFATTLPEWQKRHQALQQHKAKGPDIRLTRVMVTSEGLPKMSHHADGRGFPHFYPQTFILNRGDVHQKNAVAAPGFLQVLKPAEAQESDWQVKPQSGHGRTSFRRAALANWMTDSRTGAGALVARVIVNRLWQHHFGRGLVTTPNDFGVSGERPTHPELLEWLANDLVENGWRLKRLHHMIM
ncbi:MAG: PSD1 domain-containing protein, partial [Planctomycetaceae bacterium]|nr:PSD1 domain-containing protein [Planctomycetaceae bacterium]